MMSLPFTIRQLEYFTAVASQGALSTAAERCNVTTSALGFALDELERRLSVQLFVRRKGKGVTLTVAGERLLAHARQVLSQAEALANEAQQNSAVLAGHLTIGYFPTLGPFFIPDLLETFRAAHPGIELKFVEAIAPELHELLLQGRLDLGLMYHVDVSPQLIFDPVHAYRPYVALPAGHPFAERTRIRLTELSHLPLIMLDAEPTRQNTEQLFASLEISPNIGHTTMSFELVRCLVGRGLGYSVLFQRPASTLTYDGHEVVIREIAEDVHPSVVGLARPAGSPLTARYVAFRDSLIASAAGRWDPAAPSELRTGACGADRSARA